MKNHAPIPAGGDCFRLDNDTNPQQPSVEINMQIAQLHAELHGLIMMPADDSEIRQAFRKRTIEYCQAVGVANVTQNEDGSWDLRPENSTGRVPRRNDFVERFAKSCNATIDRNSIQMESFLGLQAIFVPINVTGIRPEVILILTRAPDYEQTLFFAEIILEYFALWLKERSSTDNSWKLNSLAAMIELVSEIERTDDRMLAGQTVVNELVRYLNCDHAVIGFTRSQRVEISAIAGQTELEASSAFQQLNETALSESCLRDELAVYDNGTNEPNHLLKAHQQLACENGYSLVVSTPLKTPTGQSVGALLIGCKRGRAGDRLSGFLRASAPRIASALEVVGRAEISIIGKFCRKMANQVRSLRGWIWISLAAVIAGLLCIPVPYKIRCNCVLNSAAKQYAVAPFDGVVQKFHVAAGDFVEQGQRLATMDGHSIRFRLAAVVADLAKANKQRDIELNRGDIPKSIVANLEAQSLAADKQLLEFNAAQIEVRSPVTGIVLAEQNEQSDGASVAKGEVFFELGTYDPILVEINIPATDIAHVEQGQALKVWVDGFESKPIQAKIHMLSPKSENRNGRNVFVASVKVDNPAGRLRPGMQGQARIDTRPRPLAWNMFHKPFDFVRSRLNWW